MATVLPLFARWVLGGAFVLSGVAVARATTGQWPDVLVPLFLFIPWVALPACVLHAVSQRTKPPVAWRNATAGVIGGLSLVQLPSLGAPGASPLSSAVPLILPAWQLLAVAGLWVSWRILSRHT